MLLILVQFFLLFLMLLAVFMGSEQRLLPVHPLWSVLGFTLVVVSGGLALAAFRSLGRSFRVAPAPKQDATMVTAGIYRRLRHPMYTAVVSLAIGTFLLRSSWEVGVSAAAVVLFYVLKARYEERLLLDHYPEYKNYRSRSRGVIPLR